MIVGSKVRKESKDKEQSLPPSLPPSLHSFSLLCHVSLSLSFLSVSSSFRLV